MHWNDYARAPIAPINGQAADEAHRYVDGLVKPLGSLGRLEEYVVKLSGILGYRPASLEKRGIAVFAADNGVWEEGITPVSQDVTWQQAVNMTIGLSGVGAMSGIVSSRLDVYDVGIKGDVPKSAVRDKKIARGTANFVKGPAMSREEAERALVIGYEAALELAKEAEVLGCGEMGICNTSSASAVLCALTGMSIEDAVGMGAGITPEQFEKKKRCVQKALDVNQPKADDPVDVLSKVGGFDLAAMCGFYIGAAAAGRPVIVDGYLAMVAALVAVRLRAEVRAFLIGSHVSREKAFCLAAEAVGIEPVLDLHMRLGEGTGCPLMMLVLDHACKTMDRMASFEKNVIKPVNYVDLRKTQK